MGSKERHEQYLRNNREQMKPKRRMLMAIEECQKGDYSDLSFLLEIAGEPVSAITDGTNMPYSYLREDLRKLLKVRDNNTLNSLLDAWKEQRKRQYEKQ